MGKIKNIKITEEQLRVITKDSILEGDKVKALIKQYETIKDDNKNLQTIKDYSSDFFEFLDDVRESGVVNMFQASDLLWSGSEFIEKYAYIKAPHLSDDLDDDGDFSEHKEAFDRVLSNADDIRDKIISATIGSDQKGNIDSQVKTLCHKVLTLWMKHYGTKKGRMKTDVDEIARTLSKARRHGNGNRFPQSAVKANPNRFRPAKRVNEHFFFGNETPDVHCDNCGHSWEVRPEDNDPQLCHMCAYDQSTETYDLDKVIDFWTNKKEN